jgi:copper(I)-binding protein
VKKLLAAALVTLAAISISACAPIEKSDLTIVDGWVRYSEYSDHVDGMTGAFASITNNTDHEITIVGGSSEIAGMVEVHEVVMADGAMKMQAKEGGIAIAPGKTITLEPGGLHIMLMGLKKAVLEGDEVSMTIDFDGTDDLSVTWPVKTSLAGDETYAPKN